MKPTVFAIALMFVMGLSVQTTFALDDGPKTLKVGKNKIEKNGTGTRVKAFLSLYDGTLYLKTKSSDASAIIEADEPMAVRIKITSRFVSQAKMVAALNDGFSSATGGDTSAIDDKIKQFRACFSDAIKMNDVFIVVYVPDKGVVVYKNNKKKGVVGDLEFKKAVFGIWLGDNPVDASLKSGMLGQ